MTQEHVIELLPGYALEILDDQELLQVARHLPTCEACRFELESLVAVRERMAALTPEHEPPAGLKGRVLQRVQAASQSAAGSVPAELPAAVKQKAAGWAGLSELFRRPAGVALAVLALALLVLLSISNYQLWQRVQSMQALIPPEQVLLARLDGTEHAPDATGYVIVFRDNRYGSLTVENAPLLEEGQQYQVWLMRDGERVSGGVFSVTTTGYGVLQVYSREPLDRYDSFGITVEPAGGSPEPTGIKVLGGTL